jgi:hypothetical protein
MHRIKIPSFLLFVAFFVSTIRCGDIELIDAVNKGNYDDVAMALLNANPNCKVGKDKDPILSFAIKRLIDEINKGTVSIPRELKRLVVGTLLLTPSALYWLSLGVGVMAGPDTAALAAIIGMLLVLILPILTILFAIAGLIGCVKICRALWRMIIAKPFQEIMRASNISNRYKVIEALLRERRLDASAQNANGQTALDLVREHSLNESLVSKMSEVEKLLLNKQLTA